MKALLFLPQLARFSDIGLAALRMLAGGFLVYGVWDNVTSAAHMQEFVAFMAAFGFPSPEILAPLSVYAQLVTGALLFVGLLTRWAALVIAFNFVVGVISVHWDQTFREWWPAIVLVGIGLLFATVGPGKWSLDAMIGGEQHD
ncbi:DoxX family protein [uncultured Parasphingopyxis sp.]|uniref:DoxX family protein n=1 Tax=uncultured Parasphingopyxis sp. TaxID=1547918 RepID=UPI0026072818|nr:DoxX family protein [uncultured Parasphingopyxis sp.]